LIYETDLNRVQQQGVIDRVKTLWDGIFIPTPASDLHHIDFYYIRNYIHVCEIKCRNNHSFKYPTFFISHTKWKKGKELAAALGSKSHFFLLIQFLDGIFVSDETNKTDEGTRFVKSGGRKDRGSRGNDIEMMIHIPIKEMTKLL
jgi:hypothetical protein